MAPIDVPGDDMTTRPDQDTADSTRRKTTRIEWVHRWKDDVASEPELPGVWRRRDGGFHVRGRTNDPRSGKMREVNRELPNVTRARDAFAWLHCELERIRSGVVAETPSVAPQFRAYAAAVFARKLALGKIRSAAGTAKWESILEHHLDPAFGDLFIDRLAPADIKAWQARIATKIKAGEMA